MLYLPPPYPTYVLPGVLGDAAREIQRVVQAPDALISMALLAAASLATQGLADVRRPTGQKGPISLQLLVLAESGERKSTVDKLVFAPFYQHDQAASISYRQALTDYHAEVNLWKIKCATLRRTILRQSDRHQPTEGLQDELSILLKEKKPTRPRLRRFVRQNITDRAIIEAVQGDGESIGLITDEGQILLKSDAMAHLGTLNKLWDGPELMPMDRADYEHILVANPRATVFLASQRSAFHEYLLIGQQLRQHIVDMRVSISR